MAKPSAPASAEFGPYVQHVKTYASLEEGDDVFHIGLNRAVTLLAEKRAKPSRFRRFGGDPGKPLGDHPDKGGPIVAKNGRYGPYVSHDGVNATLPQDKTPDTITLAEAVALLDARSGRGPSSNARRRKTPRPSPGTARHIKASSKRRGAATARKAPTNTKPARKSPPAAE